MAFRETTIHLFIEDNGHLPVNPSAGLIKCCLRENVLCGVTRDALPNVFSVN
jgi:hypothetical protein